MTSDLGEHHYRTEADGYSTLISGRRIRVAAIHSTGLHVWAARFAGVEATGATRDDAVRALVAALHR
jgi:hypothetical protein